MEHDVLSEGRGKVLPVQVSLCVSLILQLLAVLRSEVQIVKQFVEAAGESIVVDEVHGGPGHDRSDGQELDLLLQFILQLFDRLLNRQFVLNNFEDDVWQRDEQFNYLLPALEVLDAVHIIRAGVHILTKEQVDLPLEPYLYVEYFFILFVELDGINFQSLPVDFDRNFFHVSELSFHVFLVLLLDLGDA